MRRKPSVKRLTKPKTKPDSSAEWGRVGHEFCYIYQLLEFALRDLPKPKTAWEKEWIRSIEYNGLFAKSLLEDILKPFVQNIRDEGKKKHG